MNHLKFVSGICMVCLFLSSARAPMIQQGIEEKFYHAIIETEWQRRRASLGFMKWPKYFNHSQEEIYNMGYKESRFVCNAYHPRTHARGLYQLTESAICTLQDGHTFYRYKRLNNRRIKFLNKPKVYDPYWNTYLCCAFLRRCKDIARRRGPLTVGKFSFTTNEMARAFYVVGYGSFNNRILVTLRYIQN